MIKVNLGHMAKMLVIGRAGYIGGLHTCGFVSEKTVARYFNESEQAV